MTDQNLLLSEDGYPNAPDIKARLRSTSLALPGACADIDGEPVNLNVCTEAAAHIEQLERELAEARKDAELDAKPYCWFHEKSATVHRTSFPPSLNCFPLYLHPAPSQPSAEALVQAALEAASNKCEQNADVANSDGSYFLLKAAEHIRALSAQQIIESCKEKS